MQDADLKRSISLGQFFAMSFGSSIGVGWIMLMGFWLATAGSLGAAVAFLIGGLAIGWVALGYLELATAIPKPGAEMIFAFEAFGPRAGFIVGWFLAASNVAISAFETVSIGWIASVLTPIPDGPVLFTVLGEEVYAMRAGLGLIFLVAMGWLNYRGAVFAAFVQTLCMVLFFAAVAVFLIAGVVNGDTANLRPFFSGASRHDALLGIFSMLAITPFFILGFNFALQGIAERAAGVTLRGVAWSIILSVIATSLFYAAVIVVAAMSAPRAIILAADFPTAAAFRHSLGAGWLGQMVLLAGLLGLLMTWNATLFAAARIVFELSVNGLLPRMFSRIHPRHGSPHIAAIFVTLASAPAVVLSQGALGPIMAAASLCGIFALFVTCLAVRAHRRKPGALRAVFTLPGGKRGEVMLIATGALLFVVSFLEPFVAKPVIHLPPHWLFVGAWAVIGWLLWSLGIRSPAVSMGRRT